MHRYLVKVLLALLSGFLLGLSFPSDEIFAFSWIALIPLLLALHKTESRIGFILAYITGFSFFSNIYQWGFIFGVHVFLALALWQGFYVGLWGASTSWTLREDTITYRRIIFPALFWLCYEFIKAQGPLGTNWGALAYSQYKWIQIIQISGFTGIYGISFLIALVNSTLAELIHRLYKIYRDNQGKGTISALKNLFIKDHQLSITSVITLLLFFFTLTYGYYRIRIDTSSEKKYSRLTITNVQPNMDMCLKWDEGILEWTLDILENLSRQGIKNGGKLVIWPETSIPTYLSHNTAVKDRILKFCQEEGIYLLAGAPSFGKDNLSHNTVYLFTPHNMIMAEYSKRHLVPFGEYLPFEKYLRKYHLFDRVQNFSPGKEWITFRTPWAQFSVLICFESDFPNIARINVRNGAQFLVVVTNDAWFERSSAANHHIGWNVFRAVENHSNLIQSANTGICAFIDYHGKIYRNTRIFTRTEITDNIVLASVGTFYTRFGDIFSYLCILITGYLVVLELKKGKKAHSIEKRKRKKGKK